MGIAVLEQNCDFCTNLRTAKEIWPMVTKTRQGNCVSGKIFAFGAAVAPGPTGHGQYGDTKNAER